MTQPDKSVRLAPMTHRLCEAATAALTTYVLYRVIVEGGKQNTRAIQLAGFWVRTDIAAQRAAWEWLHGDPVKAQAIEDDLERERVRLFG